MKLLEGMRMSLTVRGYWGATAVQQGYWARHSGSRKTEELMTLVGGSAKFHQERRQQENPKQIHNDYVCESTTEIESAREGLQRGLRLRDLTGDKEMWRQPAQLHQP